MTSAKTRSIQLLSGAVLGLAASTAYASEAAKPVLSRPLVLIALIAGLSLLPFALMMLTSFVKVAVVLSIVRSAIGAQQIPPNQIVIGLSIILSLYIMAPVGERIQSEVKGLVTLDEEGGPVGFSNMVEALKKAREPLKDFLSRNTSPKEKAMFANLAKQMRKGREDEVDENGLLVLAPAFVISQLREAFYIGFAIFLPFLVIDMVVANILMGLGMHMLSPSTVSLPFKFLLFVMVDGWALLCRGLILGYR